MNAALRGPEARGNPVRGLIRILRPKQWIKNGFVAAPLIFTGEFTDPTSVRNTLLAILIFSVGASSTYIFNDYHDIEHDRLHPKKSKTRPLAAGDVSKGQALALLAGLLACLTALYPVQPSVVDVVVAYLCLNLSYTFVLKHQPVLDIFSIAIGFVLRVYAGAQALSVPVSAWMFATTLCLALYLAAIKRRQELKLSGNEGRNVLRYYSLQLVDRYAEMAATGALLFYSLFVVTTRPELVLTIPLVLFGLFRYWYVVEAQGDGESPTDALLKDWQLLISILIWTGLCAWTLWPTR